MTVCVYYFKFRKYYRHMQAICFEITTGCDMICRDKVGRDGDKFQRYRDGVGMSTDENEKNCLSMCTTTLLFIQHKQIYFYMLNGYYHRTFVLQRTWVSHLWRDGTCFWDFTGKTHEPVYPYYFSCVRITALERIYWYFNNFYVILLPRKALTKNKL